MHDSPHRTIAQDAQQRIQHYDSAQSYDWNYANAPDCNEVLPSPGSCDWNFFGIPTYSPLGIAAGPLLNGRWIRHYAACGFDVLTYKTVRSRARACYPMPNLQPITAHAVNESIGAVDAASAMHGSWAVSFGMPSKSPEVWRADIEATRSLLPRGKVLSVSVVATPEPHWSLEQVADDFAACARWAIDSGADCVEANFSCPNVASADGQLFQQPGAAAQVAKHLRVAVGKKPLLIKIGHITDSSSASALCLALAPHVDGLVMVNCISATIQDNSGHWLFDGQKRGIAGAAIREACLDQVKLFVRVIRESQLSLGVVGVGGISAAADVKQHLEFGCRAVQLATAAMLDPFLGLRLRAELLDKNHCHDQ